MSEKPDTDRTEDLPLSKTATFILEECRMVLPGIQALFGFQLIAVFNNGFEKKLDHFGQSLHLLAIALVSIAAALIMTPAAYHRQALPRKITDSFIAVSSLLLLFSMVPLALGICLDFYLVAKIIVPAPLSLAFSLGLLVCLLTLWYVLPQIRRMKTNQGA